MHSSSESNKQTKSDQVNTCSLRLDALSKIGIDWAIVKQWSVFGKQRSNVVIAMFGKAYYAESNCFGRCE